MAMQSPVIKKGAFVSQGSFIIGDVELEEDTVVLFAVLRGGHPFHNPHFIVVFSKYLSRFGKDKGGKEDEYTRWGRYSR